MKIHHRRSIRLPGYDYTSEGAYFVTLVTHRRERLFGKIVDDEMVLNEFGKIVYFTWNDLPNHNPDIGLDEFIIMPNHIHFIVYLFNPAHTVGAGSQPAPVDPTVNDIPAGLEPRVDLESRAGLEPAPTKKRTSLSEIVRQFKTFSARCINTSRGTPGAPVWQRNDYDPSRKERSGVQKPRHIISTDREHETIAAYIANNPSNWINDNERNPW